MGRILDALIGPSEATIRAAAPPAAPAERRAVTPLLSDAIAARAGQLVTTRNAAIRLSVVNRARDLICGTVSLLPLVRVRDRGGVVEELGAGWLANPDPTRTLGAFTAGVTEDLFFYADPGHAGAYCRVTARDTNRQVVAVEHMPYLEVVEADTIDHDTGGVWWRHADDAEMHVAEDDVIRFESPLTGILRGGCDVLTIAARLDSAARRFAGWRAAVTHLRQTGGEPLTADEMLEQLQQFLAMRELYEMAYLNESVELGESTMDPARMQLVEGRSYQDVALARICNVPAFTVNAAVPGDSMTYKTALTARYDLVDFGIAPYLTCWEQTLTLRAMPAGTSVRFDLEPFLRSAQLAGAANPSTPDTGGTA